jgi:segregation and condensation protein A
VSADVAATDPFQVALDRFQGPLDLLLHLIRNQDIDIFDIPIARITEQFLRAVEGIRRSDLERAGEFLEMAATLVRIKAQMLFPRRGGEDEEDPRADLVRRLLEYEHFREAALRLEGAQRERSRVRAKGFIEARPLPALADAPLETGWDEVWAAVLRLAERIEAPEEPGYRFATRPVRIEEKIDLVLATLGRLRRVEFATLVSPWGTRMHAVVSLLACLELAKRHVLRLRQTEPFSPLWLYRPESREA